MQVTSRLRRKRRILTTVATAVLLFICAGIIYSSSLSKEAINDYKNSEKNPSAGQNLLFNLLIFLPAVLVTLINMVLAVTIRKFSSMEMHKTVTDYDTSVMMKLTVSMFLNTAVVAMAYHWGRWYEPAGLTQEVYNILISNAIVQPLLTIFSPGWLWKKLRQCCVVRRGANSLLSQQEANDLFEGLPLDMAQRCASFMKTYLLTIFYAPILPLAYPLGVLALVLQYWADKFMLLRVHARPDTLSNDLDDAMLDFMAMGTMLYAATNMLFYYDFETAAAVPGIVGLVSTFAYNFLPVQRLVKVIRRKAIRKTAVDNAPVSESEKTYEEALVDFVEDYDRCNPVTKEAGVRLWKEAVRKKARPSLNTHENHEEKTGDVEKEKSMFLRKRLGLGGAKRRTTTKAVLPLRNFIHI